MKKLCMVLTLLGLFLTLAACSKTAAPKNIEFHGTLQAVHYTITAVKDGEVRGLILAKGERIRKGQPLLGLGTQENNPQADKAAADLAKAQAEMNRLSYANSIEGRATAALAVQNTQNRVQEAQQKYNKMQQLYTIGGISKIRMQQAQDELNLAHTELNAAQTRFQQSNQPSSPADAAAIKLKVEDLKKAYETTVLSIAGSEISSPTTGTVQAIWVKNGTKVKEKQNLLEILSATDCTITIPLSTPDSRLKEGMAVKITNASLKIPFDGIIRKIEGNTITIYSDKKPEELPDGTAVVITVKPESENV